MNATTAPGTIALNPNGLSSTNIQSAETIVPDRIAINPAFCVTSFQNKPQTNAANGPADLNAKADIITLIMFELDRATHNPNSPASVITTLDTRTSLFGSTCSF